MTTKALAGFRIKSEEEGTVEAVFATLGVIDKDGDVTMPGAYKSGAEVVVSAYGHRSWDGALPIGKGRIFERGNEAILEAKLFLDTTHGADAFRVIKQLDGLQEWSYSLHDVVSRKGTHDGKDVTFLDSITVKEVSPVLVGAGVNTRTLATKGAGLKFSDHLRAVMAEVDEVAVRAAEVVALRAEKGKQIGDDTAGLVELVTSSLERLKSALITPDPTPTHDPDVLRAIVRQVARNQGVT
jgi:hypothetical protein